MEAELVDTSNPFSAEGEGQILDSDPYDGDNYDVPDPGLLSEKSELWSQERPQVQLFTDTQQWWNMTLRSRARHLWLLLRTGLHDIVEKEKREELRVARLTQGLEPLRLLEVPAGLCAVARDLADGRFVVLDGAGRLHLHRKDGWAQGKLQAPVALTGLVAVPVPLGAVGRFVGWGPSGLAILRPDLSLLWLSQPGVGRVLDREPTCCLPVPSLGLLLVAEVGGGLALWKFRSGGRRLVLRGLPLQPPPGLAGTLKRLALGPAAPHVTQCFVAYGSAVLVFDLHAWALVDVRRDLHKTTISDLAYFDEAKAMLTASRDSTVKVWETNWQIRSVFVGHTGPVTALAAIPGTWLAASASLDGTLRTWDLRAAEQVGQAALCAGTRDARAGRAGRLLAPAGPGWPLLALGAGSVALWSLRRLYAPLARLPAPVLLLQPAPPLPAPAAPSLPARLACACADGSVWVLAAPSGRAVSGLLLAPEDRAAALAYCLPREALWVLTRAGHLVRANAARCPMNVLHRVFPPPPPAAQPCCLHLYSHLADPRGALECWETLRRHRGDLRRSALAWAWKNKNRYLPVIGRTDGTLAVIDWRSSKTIFQTKAHSPGPVTAIASTWNSIVSSGGDLTVKMWRVFPYAEESLSLLCTFSCCHLATALCVLGKRITVGFEDPNSATYGLVQFSLGEDQRCDHRTQDDPTDHITGLCCCPTLKLYACSSLDCTVRIWTFENRLLRLLQLDGAPQALAFCSNSGDLVLALDSRLCLVSHMTYLPTSYLVKKLYQKAPDVLDDPPLPLTNPESLTPIQLQRLASVQGAASLRAAPPTAHRQTTAPQYPVLKEDLEALVARDQDLQQLKMGLVAPTARPPPSWKQRQEAFDNYLRLIYGAGLLDVQSKRESQQWTPCGTISLTTDRELQDASAQAGAATCSQQTVASSEAHTALLASQAQGPGHRRFARPPRIPLPIPPIPRKVHSKASQLLARSSLRHELGLSLDLQLQSEYFQREMTITFSSASLQHRVPLLPERRPKELLSNLGGFFPATVHPEKCCPRPISFPGFVPNSAVLQQMWLPAEVGCLGSLAQLAHTGDRLKPDSSLDDLWLGRHRTSGARWRKRLLQWLHGKPEEEEEEEAEEEDEEDRGLELEWFSDSSSPQEMYSDLQLDSWDRGALDSMDVAIEPHKTHRTDSSDDSQHSHVVQLLWEEHHQDLPKFLQFFVTQNWFKKLFPVFTLEAYPEMGSMEGLASMLVEALARATWADRVHILQALLRLLPDVSSDLCDLLQGSLLHLLNLDEPPSLQDYIEKQFVVLALQLLLACSLESRDVVLELMSYFLFSPATCQSDLKKMLDGLGLQDPQGLLFKEMLTWVQGSDLDSKAMLRALCCQKLDGMVQQLQMETSQPFASAVLPKVSGTWVPSPREGLSQVSMVSGVPSSMSWLTLGPSQSLLQVPEPPSPAASEAQGQEPQVRTWHSKQALSEMLQRFCSMLYRTSMPAAFGGLLPLEKNSWSQLQTLDLYHIDALNYFCQQKRAQLQNLMQREAMGPCLFSPSPPPVPNTVVPPPREHWPKPILRLQEAKARRSGMRLRGRMLSRLCSGRALTLDGSIRMLKLPLPRVELQPFPPGWPAPARALPPLLLQPALQRYFLLDDADPG